MSERVLGLYLDEFPLNEEYVSAGRTVTETDIVTFSGISGDYNQLHSDAEFAKTSPFGQRIAHGALVLSMATGLTSRLGVIEGTAIAFLGLTWKYSKPVYIGDTIRVKLKAVKKRAVAADAGVLIVDLIVVNQRDEKCQSGEWTVMVKRKPAQGS
jgi:acyl dehydratase